MESSRTWGQVIIERFKEDKLKHLVDSKLRRYYGSLDSASFPVFPSWNVVDSEYYDFSPSIRCLLHWGVFRDCFCKDLHSDTLKMLFYYVEDAPLLCILEDFFTELDQFLFRYQTLLKDQVGRNKGEDGPQHRDTSPAEGEPKLREPCAAEELGLDVEYVCALEMYCLLKQRLLDVKYSWRKVVQGSFADHEKHAGFARTYHATIVATLEKLVGLSQTVLSSLCSQEEQPKFVQLCQQLHLTEKEQDALSFIFISNVGVLFGQLHSRFSSSDSKAMYLSTAAFAQLSSKETLDMFDENRLHLKQELLAPEDEFTSLHSTSLIAMPTSVLKACCGCTLTPDDRYKIDKTAMGDIISKARERSGVKTSGSSTSLDKEGGVAVGGASLAEVLEEARDISELEEEIAEELAERPGVGVSSTDERELTMELEDILKSCNLDQSTQSKQALQLDISGADIGDIKPYTSDLDYLEDNFKLVETLGKALKVEDDSDNNVLFRSDQRKPEAVVRELKAKSRSLKAKIGRKIEATRKLDGWLPRLERLAELRGLDQFEKDVLLVLTGTMVSKNLRTTGQGGGVFFHHLNIGAIISLFCDGLKEQVESRMYFYKNSKLVREGLIKVSDPPLHNRGNFLDSVVELDRRLLDYIVGLDTEINELVDGSDLYTPSVTLSDVALPHNHKQLLYDTFQSFDQFQKTCKELGLSTKGTNKGICMLFYGASGTGKTMTANAVANYLKKKILLVTVSLLLDKDLTKELLRFLFREAKIHNAVLFFDECECLFETRDSRPNPTLGVLLTEIEQYSGVIILATNRHKDLDEAMHRRIQLALPFSVPDYALREEIWRSHVPSSIAAADINWHNLALSHELTGGLICNAVLSALSLALKECSGPSDQPILTEQTLTLGAKLQLRGLLEMVDFEHRVIPTFGVRDLVLAEDIQKQLQLILNAGKTHKFISAQWGFGGGENVAHTSGIMCLISGGPGVGKTAIARAIAYELGQPIKEANCTELLSHTFNTAPRSARGVTAFFRDAQRANAIVVVEGSETLLSNTTSSLMTGMVGCEHLTLIHQIEHFSGIVILTSRRSVGQLDLDRLPKLKYVLDIGLPSVELREKLWKQLIPKKAPTSDDIDHHVLAERFQFSGGDIASVVCQAAERCATQTTPTSNTPAVISHRLLLTTAEYETKRKQQRTFIPSLFS